MPKNHLESLLKCGLLSPFPRDSDSLSLGWGLKIYISNKSAGDGDAAGLGTTLRVNGLKFWVLGQAGQVRGIGESYV